uniref:Serine/threonine-protein kinase S6KL n=1 Tax=Cacopsylla melanoneura TaxID=428564 RepID=A0A8D8W4Y1_9HEMI
MGNRTSRPGDIPSPSSSSNQKRFSLPIRQLSISNLISGAQSTKSAASGFTQVSKVSKVSRPWSKISRRQWQDSTLNNPYKAAQTAWPVPQIEALFLPEFSIQGLVTLEHFEMKEFIAQGSYGKVYRAIKKDTNQVFAIKILNKSQILSEDLVAQVKAEVKIQSMCGHHPFIVNAPFYWQTHKQLYLVSQYYEGGELLDLIRSYNGPFPEPVVKIYVAEMALALDFLHNAGVIYRDLKAENILLDSEGHAHLTDFGLSKWLPLGGRTNTMCGTDKYMAPEIGQVDSYTHAVDWWALGVLTHVLLSSKYPYEDGSPKLSPYVSMGAHNLVNRLLTKDPRLRLRSIMTLEITPFFHAFKFSEVRSKKVSPKKLLEDLTSPKSEPKPPDILLHSAPSGNQHAPQPAGQGNEHAPQPTGQGNLEKAQQDLKRPKQEDPNYSLNESKGGSERDSKDDQKSRNGDKKSLNGDQKSLNGDQKSQNSNTKSHQNDLKVIVELNCAQHNESKQIQEDVKYYQNSLKVIQEDPFEGF